MKSIIVSVCIAICFIGTAQKPETVYGFAKEQREQSWYETQLKLWKAEIDKDKTNGNAWYNYYKAARGLRNLSSDNTEKRTEYQSICAKIVEDAYTAIPYSFEANALKWAEGGNSKELFPYLKKAYEINPDDARIYEDLATYYETAHNKTEYSKACQLMYNGNVINASILNWGYNMLSEVDQNAIIFTAGDNDTYSAWVVQEAKQFRKDVKIVNLSLMIFDDYRNKLFKELNMPPLDVVLEAAVTQEEFDKSKEMVINHFIANGEKRPVYVAVSAIQSLNEKWSENLYLTGLTYKYATEEFDNTSIILRNYEHRYLMDHLKMTFFSSIGEKMADQLNGCYLPSMLKLYQHYKDSEQTAKMKELEELLILISHKSGQESEVMAIIGSNPIKTK